jgi:hypothetical protein
MLSETLLLQGAVAAILDKKASKAFSKQIKSMMDSHGD